MAQNSMKGTMAFQDTIRTYLDNMAESDALFAVKYANPSKSLSECITYIICQVHKSGCNGFEDDEIFGMAVHWKTQARMTPAAKVDLTPENNLFLTPEEFGRRGQFYFGLSAFEGFEFTDAFAGERDTVCGVDDAVEDGIRHCGVADGVVPVQFGEL